MEIPSGYTILKLPQWILFIRIAQAAIALVVFGLVCYGESISSFDGKTIELLGFLLPDLKTMYTHIMYSQCLPIPPKRACIIQFALQKSYNKQMLTSPFPGDGLMLFTVAHLQLFFDTH
jgi:hypothetical protein